MAENILGFSPLMLDEFDTSEVVHAIEASGHRFAEEGLKIPDLYPGQKLEITDSSQAALLRNCLNANAELCERQAKAHNSYLERVHEYHLPMPSKEQMDRLTASRTNFIEAAEVRRAIGCHILAYFELDKTE